jgi:hypothetical protein
VRDNVSMRPSILDQLSATRKAQLLDELVEFLATPSFGAWPKREIEVKVVSLLYESQLRDGSLSVAAIAEDLTLTRARGRSLILDARTRLLSRAEDRTKTLAALLKRWPDRAQVDESDGRLRLVVEDPFVRDLLRNHAYAAGIPLDTSFANELISLRWSDYAALLASVLPASDAEEVAKDVGAAIRRDLAHEKESLAQFEKAMKAWEKRSPQERARRLLELGIEHVPVQTVVGALVSAL